MAGLHQAVAHRAQGVGLAGARQSEGQHVDAVFGEVAVGQLIQLLPQGQGHPVVLEGFPSLARGQPGHLAQPVDAPLAAVVSLLLQHLKKCGQGFAMAGGGETSHRLGPHGGQLELVAQLADALLHDAGVHHPHTPAVARLPVSSRS